MVSEINEKIKQQWVATEQSVRPAFVMSPDTKEVTQLDKKPPVKQAADREKQPSPPDEFTINRTTLNFAMDKESNQMVLKIKDENGDVVMQIPEEARLRISRHIRKTYEQPRNAIFEALA